MQLKEPTQVACYILVVTWALVICLICMPPPSGLWPSDSGVHIRQTTCTHVTTITYNNEFLFQWTSVSSRPLLSLLDCCFYITHGKVLIICDFFVTSPGNSHSHVNCYLYKSYLSYNVPEMGINVSLKYRHRLQKKHSCHLSSFFKTPL